MRAFVLLVTLLASSCGGAVPSDACVPASCCHATACVPIEDRPVCEDVACTEDCRSGTLDCGFNHCAITPDDQCVMRRGPGR